MAKALGRSSAQQPLDPVKLALMKAKKKMAEVQQREKNKAMEMEERKRKLEMDQMKEREKMKRKEMETKERERKRAIKLQRKAAREALEKTEKEAAALHHDEMAVQCWLKENRVDPFGTNMGTFFKLCAWGIDQY